MLSKIQIQAEDIMIQTTSRRPCLLMISDSYLNSFEHVYTQLEGLRAREGRNLT
jgi:hypothetical protein